MGLDVYLYRYENFDRARAIEKETEDSNEQIWETEIAAAGAKNYSGLSDEQKDAIRAKIHANTKAIAEREGLPLNDYGDVKVAEKIENDSAQYPDHLFKVGYFRSSYNGSGLNNVLRNAIGKTLYDIFNAGDDYYIKPDWQEARKNCLELIELYKAHMDKAGGARVLEVSPNEFGMHPNFKPPTDERSALDEWVKAKGEQHPFGSYSSGLGHFFIEGPMKVRAIIHGTKQSLFSDERRPCIYVVYEEEDESKAWYINSLKIVLETIDWVISQPDPEKYVLHWSS